LACAWRAGPPQLGCRVGLAASDREFPRFTARSGTQRARAYLGEHLIRRSGQVVQDRPSPVVGWADIPELSTCVGCRPAAWLQCWLQSRHYGADPRPSAFQAGHLPSWHRSCESAALSLIADARRWWLLLLSPLLSAEPGRCNAVMSDDRSSSDATHVSVVSDQAIDGGPAPIHTLRPNIGIYCSGVPTWEGSL
jgi:hypothetical protein